VKTLIGAAEPPERPARPHVTFFGTPGLASGTIVTTTGFPDGPATVASGADLISAVRYVVRSGGPAGR
jgi:hypothetical protein